MEAEKRRPKRQPQAIDINANPDAHLHVDTVAALTGIAVSTIWRMVNRGEFPEPLRLTHPVRSRWPAHVILAWLKQGAEA